MSGYDLSKNSWRDWVMPGMQSDPTGFGMDMFGNVSGNPMEVFWAGGYDPVNVGFDAMGLLNGSNPMYAMMMGAQPQPLGPGNAGQEAMAANNQRIREQLAKRQKAQPAAAATPTGYELDKRILDMQYRTDPRYGRNFGYGREGIEEHSDLKKWYDNELGRLQARYKVGG